MKKIISKITILVLIVAMLLPFASIPKVSADTTECSAGETPEYHTNYYFFLQAEIPFSWAEMFQKDSNGNYPNAVTTNYYTSFLYNFPSDGTKMVITDKGFVEITDNASTANFNPAKEHKTWTAGQFYQALQQEIQSSQYSGNLKEYAFSVKESGTGSSDSDRIVSYLYHGDWAHVGSTSSTAGWEQTDSSNRENLNWDLNRISLRTGGLDTTTANIQKLTDASIFISNNEKTIAQAKIGTGTLNKNSGVQIDEDALQTAIENYSKSKKSEGGVSIDSSINQPVIHMIVQRTYGIKTVFNKTSNMQVIEAKSNDGTVTVNANGQSNKELSYAADEGDKSYTITPDEGGTTELSDLKPIRLIEGTASGQTSNVWFLAPTLYQMSYYVCKASNEATGDTVTITYDGNGNGDTVSNVPGADTINKGNDYTVSNQKPTRSGHTFKNWNTDPACKSGKTIEPSAKLTNLQNNTTLFACWGETGTKDSPGTGVLTYAGLFTGIIAIAGGAYYVVKKKNLFKKI